MGKVFIDVDGGLAVRSRQVGESKHLNTSPTKCCRKLLLPLGGSLHLRQKVIRGSCSELAGWLTTSSRGAKHFAKISLDSWGNHRQGPKVEQFSQTHPRLSRVRGVLRMALSLTGGSLPKFTTRKTQDREKAEKKKFFFPSQNWRPNRASWHPLD